MTDVPLPCSREEWEASVDALNQARAAREAAQAAYVAAQDRVRANLRALGVQPEEL